jgi:hypothetical protein
MNELPDKPRCQEEVADLEQQVEMGRKMKSLVSHPGWEDFADYLANGKLAAMADWLKKAESHADFLCSKQAYNTLDAVQKWPYKKIVNGDAAYEKLHPLMDAADEHGDGSSPQ